jgi:3-dehydroquinate synthetase
MQADKKKRDGFLRFVLPRSIGDVEYGVRVRDGTVRAVLERLGTLPGGNEFN